MVVFVLLRRGGVFVAVMEIWDVRVQVRQLSMSMGVLVSFDHFAGVLVFVVAVVVLMFVVVLGRGVVVFVLMVATQDEADSDRGDGEGDHLAAGHLVGEHGPGDDGTDERGGSEHELPAGGAEVAGAGDPQGDREPVADPADGERAHDRPTGGGPSSARPIARFAPPAKMPLTRVMWAGASSSRLAVTQLSTPQHRHAPAISSAPQRRSASPDQPSVALAVTTSAVPATTRLPMCSPNTKNASSVVNTSSRLSSNDAVAAGAWLSPAARSTGPTAPPITTATDSRTALRLTARRVGRCRPIIGSTAIAAPR